MNTLINLLEDHQIGRWCKRAAWIIVAIGILEVISNFFVFWQELNQSGQIFTLEGILRLVGYSLAPVPSTLFDFFLLYAAGVLVDHFVGPHEDEEGDDERAPL